MALPSGVPQLGSFKGAKGDKGLTGTLAFVTAETIPADQPAEAQMIGTESNRGVHLKVSRGLPGLNAVPTDDAIATYIPASDTATGRAVRDATGVLSAAPYIVGDGIADDSDGLIAAASAANAAGLPLYIPPVDVRITKTVTLYGSVRSEARFLAAGTSNARIVLGRDGSPTAITPSAVTGLTKGSTQTTGIGGSGTLIIVSSEELIGRYMSGPAAAYTKQEAVRVGVDGSAFPPIDNTYDLTKVTTLDLHAPETPTQVTGIEVIVDGAAAGANDNFVTIARSNVEVRGLRVINTTGQALTSAVRIQDAVSVALIAPKIHGFDLNGAGYGIAKYRSSDIRIEDAEITQCRHAVTGRYENRVRLVRGFYGGGVDTHWGTGLVAEAITSIVPGSGTHFAVAGGSVAVIGGDFFGGRNLVGIRADTPELAGIIEVRGAKWTCDASTGTAPTPWVVGYSTINDGGHGYDFGHILAAPSVLIHDVVLTLPTPRVASAVTIGAQSFQRNHLPAVEIDNFQVVNPGARVVAAALVKSATTLPDTGSATAVTVRRMTFPAANDAGISITNEGDTPGGAMFKVLVEDSMNVAIKVPEPSTSNLVIRRSRVIQLMRVAASAQTFVGDWSIEDCDLAAPALSGYWLADFLRCRWSGAVTNTQAPVNSRCKSYITNRAVIGATGVPTVADPYRNPAYYA
ncbi:MAG: hypothetical protein P0Y60_14415 [Candidatus Microbacterium colombiense]|nr:MAG: hypothetical protein P0Y60_14415 [Microbacterium sp.]